MALDNLLTLEDGARLYLEHLKTRGKDARAILTFFNRYNPNSNEIAKERSPLHRHSDKYKWQKKKSKLPKNIETFMDWVIDQVPSDLGREIQHLTNKHIPKHTLEEAVQVYVQYVYTNKEGSSPPVAFFQKYDLATKKMLSWKAGTGTGTFQRFYSQFLVLKNNGNISKNIPFDDWLKSQISPKLKANFTKIQQTYLNEYSVVDGVQLYLQYKKDDTRKNLTLAAFCKQPPIRDWGHFYLGCKAA